MGDYVAVCQERDRCLTVLDQRTQDLDLAQRRLELLVKMGDSRLSEDLDRQQYVNRIADLEAQLKIAVAGRKRQAEQLAELNAVNHDLLDRIVKVDDLERRLASAIETRDLTQQACDQARGAERLRAELATVRDLVNKSYGVVGYHQNGDIATWDEFGWPDDLDAALADADEEGTDDDVKATVAW